MAPRAEEPPTARVEEKPTARKPKGKPERLRDIISAEGGVRPDSDLNWLLDEQPGPYRAGLTRSGIVQKSKGRGLPVDLMVEHLAQHYPHMGIETADDLGQALVDRNKLNQEIIEAAPGRIAEEQRSEVSDFANEMFEVINEAADYDELSQAVERIEETSEGLSDLEQFNLMNLAQERSTVLAVQPDETTEEFVDIDEAALDFDPTTFGEELEPSPTPTPSATAPSLPEPAEAAESEPAPTPTTSPETSPATPSVPAAEEGETSTDSESSVSETEPQPRDLRTLDFLNEHFDQGQTVDITTTLPGEDERTLRLTPKRVRALEKFYDKELFRIGDTGTLQMMREGEYVEVDVAQTKIAAHGEPQPKLPTEEETVDSTEDQETQAADEQREATQAEPDRDVEEAEAGVRDLEAEPEQRLQDQGSQTSPPERVEEATDEQAEREPAGVLMEQTERQDAPAQGADIREPGQVAPVEETEPAPAEETETSPERVAEPLAEAVRRGAAEQVEAEASPEQVEAQDEEGNTLLHLAASQAAEEVPSWTRGEIAQMLLERGSSLDTENAAGQTPREMAQENDNQPFLEAAQKFEDDLLVKSIQEAGGLNPAGLRQATREAVEQLGVFEDEGQNLMGMANILMGAPENYGIETAGDLLNRLGEIGQRKLTPEETTDATQTEEPAVLDDAAARSAEAPDSEGDGGPTQVDAAQSDTDAVDGGRPGEGGGITGEGGTVPGDASGGTPVQPGEATDEAAGDGVGRGQRDSGAGLPVLAEQGTDRGATKPDRPGSAGIPDPQPLNRVESLDLPPGPKGRYQANTDAIRLVKQLEKENRDPTPEEFAALSRFVGWGGIPQAFDTKNASWQKEFADLKGILSESEYAAARRSTLNAHYTSLPVIQTIWSGLQRMGIKGGRFLEPSAGIGHFIGGRPSTIEGNWTAVELDQLSGAILGKLYSQADVRVSAFEKVDLPQSAFDLVVSNVPFGKQMIADPKYPRRSIHNYFIERSIDQAREGGLVAVITTHHTLDAASKQGREFRQHLAKKARLVGAFRLPKEAFASNAQTEVGTDILFFQRRPTGEDAIGSENWIDIGSWQGEGKIPLNQYFVDNPSHVMGRPSMEGTMYRGGNEFTVSAEGDFIPALQAAMKDLPENITAPAPLLDPPALAEGTKANDTGIPFGRVVKQGDDYQVMGDDGLMPHPGVKSQAAKKRLDALLPLRDEVLGLMDAEAEGRPDAELAKRRAKVNRHYDNFVEKFKRTVLGEKGQLGALHAPANTALIEDDPGAPLLLSVEEYDPQTGQARKGPIFNERVLFPDDAAPVAQTPHEALMRSLVEKGRVDAAYMEKLLKSGEDAIIADLRGQGLIFYNPEAQSWEMESQYLSGDVGAKLEALDKVKGADDEKVEGNRAALQAALPERLSAEKIGVQMGSYWLPPETLKDFLVHLTSATGLAVNRSPQGRWTIESWSSDQEAEWNTYGTEHIAASDIVSRIVNNRAMTVYLGRGDDRVRSPQETARAQAKAQKIREAFASWIWDNEARKTKLENIYNDQFRRTVRGRYNGDHLTFPGMAADKTLRDHQKDAAWRIVQEGRLLLGHAVGGGKTATMIASAMEMRRLGLARKIVVTVPKPLLGQWAEEVYKFYPTAKVLSATAQSMTPKNRRRFVGRLQGGDWDIILMSHEQLQKVPLSTERLERTLNVFRQQWSETLEAARSEDSSDMSVKEMENSIANMETKVEGLLDEATKWKDANLPSFDEVGIDFLMVDEAHLYKNLFFATRMGSIKGVGGAGNQRTMDMYQKGLFLRETYAGRGFVMATATPITNTMAEVYTMQRYLQGEELKARGVDAFDVWASTFGEVVSKMEVAVAGKGFKEQERFSKFMNLPELGTMFAQIADIKTRESLGLPVPDHQKHTEKVSGTEWHESFTQSLSDRLQSLKGGWKPEKGDDNALAILGEGSRAALDARFIDPKLPQFADSKVARLGRRIKENYEKTQDTKGTQAIFIQEGVPGGAETFPYYQVIKAELVRQGLPEKEIAFISDYEGPKKDIFLKKMREGTLRVAIGSTSKLGVGTNMQERLYALHHLDAPWRPTDIEQREGRILRQGNIYAELDQPVQIYTYVTEGTFDVYRWQLLEMKNGFLSSFYNASEDVREMEDVSGESDDPFLATKLEAMGDPDAGRKAEVDKELVMMRALSSGIEKERRLASVRRPKTLLDIATADEHIALTTQDQAARGELDKEQVLKLRLKVGDRWQLFSKPTEAEKTLKQMFKFKTPSSDAKSMVADWQPAGGEQQIGAIQGTGEAFEIWAVPSDVDTDTEYSAPQFYLLGKDSYPIKVPATPGGLIANISRVFRTGPDRSGQAWAKKKELLEGDLKKFDAQLATRFERQEELEAIVEEEAELGARLKEKGIDETTRLKPRISALYKMLPADEEGRFAADALARAQEDTQRELDEQSSQADEAAQQIADRAEESAGASGELEQGNVDTAVDAMSAQRAATMGRPAAPVVEEDLPPRRLEQEGDLDVQTTTGQLVETLRQIPAAVNQQLPQDRQAPPPVLISGHLTSSLEGAYDFPAGSVRVQSLDDFGPLIHEVTHALDQMMSRVVPRDQYSSRKVRSGLVDLGKTIYPESNPPGGWEAEGFAELVRLWMLDAPALQTRVAPDLVGWLETTMREQFPGVYEQMSSAKQQFATYFGEMSAQERAQAQIVGVGDFSKRLRDTWATWKAKIARKPRDAYVDWIEPADALQRIEKAVKKAFARDKGREMRAEESPYSLYTALENTADGIVGRMVSEGMLDHLGSRTGGQSLKEVMAPIKSRRAADALMVYWFAKRTVALQEDFEEGRRARPVNTGLTLEDAGQIIEELEAEHADFVQVTDDYQAWWGGVLSYVEKMSPTMREAVGQLRASTTFYMPLTRHFDKIEEDYLEIARQAQGGGANTAQGRLSAKLIGSARQIKSPLNASIARAVDLVGGAQYRRVLDSVLELAKYPEQQLIKRVPRDQVVEASRNVQDVIERLDPDLREELERAGIVLKQGDPDSHQLLLLFGPAPTSNDPHIFSVQNEGGGTEWYYINDGELLQELAGMGGMPPVSGIWQTLFAGASTMAKLGMVGVNPSFGLYTNPLRDVSTYLLMSDANPFQAFGSYLKTIGAVMTSYGKNDPVRSYHADLLDRFGNWGLEITRRLTPEAAATRGIVDRLHQSKFRQVASPRSWYDFFRFVVSAPEAFPRVAAGATVAQEVGWEEGTEPTFDQMIAVNLAMRKSTANLGSGGRKAMKWNRYIPFLMPDIAGKRELIRRMKDNPTRVALLGFGYITVPSIYLFFENIGQDWYDELEDREKWLYWHVQTGDEVIRIPKAFEPGLIFASLPEALLHKAYAKDPDAIRSWGETFFKTMLPPVENPIISTAAEQLMNYQWYSGKAIVSKALSMQEPRKQFYPYTSKAAIELGNILNVSPQRLDHITGNMFGTVGRSLNRVMFGTGPEGTRSLVGQELVDWPLMRPMFVRGGTDPQRNKYVSKVYKEREKWQRKKATETLTVAESIYERMLDDAAQTISALGYVARGAETVKERRQVQGLRSEIAQQVLKDTASSLRLPYKTARREAESLRAERDLAALAPDERRREWARLAARELLLSEVYSSFPDSPGLRASVEELARRRRKFEPTIQEFLEEDVQIKAAEVFRIEDDLERYAHLQTLRTRPEKERALSGYVKRLRGQYEKEVVEYLEKSILQGRGKIDEGIVPLLMEFWGPSYGMALDEE